ncbi:MAG: hypothetical protein CVV18_07480 [Gammaproteobacteria bacterium HGW-Gammaproteobacteria-8]|nr:MAG: hypothetical protein CVV18_07480 [Gammaproteobacteria bacterium HGW-Gammaproteobacteria-8]
MTPEPSACYTRCDHCYSVLPLPVRALAEAGGMVRCGGCGRTLNALSALYDHAPGTDEAPITVSGMPPMLTPRTMQEALPGAVDDGELAADDEFDPGGPPELHLSLEPEPAPRWVRIAWPVIALLLVALLALQLFGPERWRLDPAMLGFGDDAPVALDDALQLVSRDMHAHPSLSDAIIISAVVHNRSDRRVAWPNIEVRLFDASQQVVGQRRLGPADYLDPEAAPGEGLAPGARLPIVLEMMIESSRPAGFTMQFHYGN